MNSLLGRILTGVTIGLSNDVLIRLLVRFNYGGYLSPAREQRVDYICC